MLQQLNQSKIVNLRLSPLLYKQFQNQAQQIGLKPSTLLKHLIISMVINKKQNFDTQFDQLINSITPNNISETKAINLVNKERQKMYQAK